MIPSIEWIQHPLVLAIGMALVHFVWQGALVAGGLTLALKMHRTASPHVRYRMCMAALLLLVALPAITALQLYVFHAEAKTVAGIHVIEPSSATQPIVEAGDEPQRVVGGRGKERTTMSAKKTAVPWQGILVIGWFAGMLLFALRLFAGLRLIAQLKKGSVINTDPALSAMMQALIRKMHIGGPVRLYLSEQVMRPMLVGWFRPVILLPTSLATGLAPEFVEAILAHELVHIRRHDYLMLLLQSVVEVLFFYHPAVWWVSQQMRIEREYCCDSESVAVLNGKSVYARALLHLEEERHSRQRRAVRRFALSAGGGRLVDRIRRMAAPEAVNNPSFISLASLAIVLLLGCSVIVACTRIQKEDTAAMKYARAYEEIMKVQGTGDVWKIPQIRALMEDAAHAGSVCAIRWMPYVINPGLTANWGLTREQEGPDLGDQAEVILEWARTFEEELRTRMEKGNSEAMLWLSWGYDATWKLPELAHFSKNDSLAALWLSRAVERENANAIAFLAQKTTDEAEKVRLLEKASRLGNGWAYRPWAARHMDDPVRYFEIASLAIENEMPGVHKWLGESLDDLDRQLELGNEESIPYKQVADSLKLRERLADLPVMPETHFITSQCENGIDRWGPGQAEGQ